MVKEGMTESQNSRRNRLSSSSCGDIDMDELDHNMPLDDVGGKQENRNISVSYDTSTSSPESVAENNFSFNSKFCLNMSDEKNTEKKVHWNPSQVHALLDCIEKRMSDFRRKSVHKSVWLSIGKDMADYGDFTVEHCYNKWKNLRRDIRLFSNSNSMQKLSIRNTYIMDRVQRMVGEIGYEGSSRKSNSPISPNIDSYSDAVIPNNNANNFSSSNNNNSNNCNKVAVDSYKNTSLDDSKPILDIKKESNLDEILLEKEAMRIQNHLVQDCNNTNSNDIVYGNHRNLSYQVVEESIMSLLSDPSFSQAILMNPKLLEEILPGVDIPNILKKFIDSNPNFVNVPMTASKSQIVTNPVFNGHIPLADGVHMAVPLSTGNVPPHLKQSKNPNNIRIISGNNNNNSNNNTHSISHTQSNNEITNSWPHQLYELLFSFREEESRQMQRLDQIVNCVQMMQESTKRRLNTINQLISLAGLLIPQK